VPSRNAADAAGLAGLQRLGVGARAVLEDALARLEGQVQPVEVGVALLQRSTTRRLCRLCSKPPWHRPCRRCSASCPAWPNGVWPRSCASAIASTRSSFSCSERAIERPELRHLQRVRQPGAEQVALVVEEDLGLVDQAPERRAVHDAVAVALVLGARGAGGSDGGARAAAGAGSATWPEAARHGRQHGPAMFFTGRISCGARWITSRTMRIGRRASRRAQAVDHHEADLAAFGLLVDPHQRQVAVARIVPVWQHRALDGQARAPPAPSGVDKAGVHQAQRAADRSAAITMPQPTASPCSHSP
jgi:hypothetical protein